MLLIPLGLESNCQHLELQHELLQEVYENPLLNRKQRTACELLELQLSKLNPGIQEHFLGFYWICTFVDTAVQALREKAKSLHASEPAVWLERYSILAQVKGRGGKVVITFIITFGLGNCIDTKLP